jgi:hypothetical protein
MTIHILKMANQIILNLQASGTEDKIAAETLSHIRRFWSEEMKRQLQSVGNDSAAPISPTLAKVIAILNA